MRRVTATARLDCPLGTISLAADDACLLGLRVSRETLGHAHDSAAEHPVLAAALLQLSQLFAGERTIFDLPLAPQGSTEGETLRAGIAAIPYGETMTYGALAAQTGSIARAVGQACKTNPYPLIIPCHRVVSTAGPEFYSAGDGPRTKTWLLDFEYNNLPPEKRTRLI